ncbi:universal stress protein [Mycolicibacterium komossense]|uniref:Universal stress protein n=2 Tax=Mycolicibacterium komossense TaxID=1779 RepID=A0ABT3CJD1_9MYCO|nr:universal stress protein [Mycolicibacterium komossense]
MIDSPPDPVVVGIDGSEAAINAARWATVEAIQRNVPLRLVCTVPTDGGLLGTDGSVLEYRRHASEALRAASAAATETDQPVKIETEILYGNPSAVLVEESRTAAMVCVGSTGISAFSSRFLGSTATDLAEQALCPVAIIRAPRRSPPSPTDFIVVAVDDSAADDKVVAFALSEAALRHAPILAVGVWSEDFGDTPYDELDRRVQVWADQNPGQRIYPVTTRATVKRFLAENTDESVQLAIINSRDAHQVAAIIGPRRHPIVSHAFCSVLVVR